MSAVFFSVCIFGWLLSDRGKTAHLSAYFRPSDELYGFIGGAKATTEPLIKDIRFNDYSLFFDDDASTFYYSLVEKASNAYDPLVQIHCRSENVKVLIIGEPITLQTIEQNIPLRIFASDGKQYREYRVVCTTLPLLKIDSDIVLFEGKGKDQEMQMMLFDNRADVRQRLLGFSGLIHLRGNSTLYYPKKNYKMTIHQVSPGNNLREADLSLLGMDRHDGEWLLYSAYNDQERIRNVFSTNLWDLSSAGKNKYGIRNGMQYRFVEMFLNGKYHGLYALGYPLDTKQMTPLYHTDEVKNIYLYKKIFWNEIFTETENDKILPDYELRGLKDSADEEKIRLLLSEYIRSMDNGFPEGSRILPDMGNAIDTWLFVNLVQGMDIVRPDGDFYNMFLTLVLTDSVSVMLYTPWDFDMTWGNFWLSDAVNYTLEYELSPCDNSYVMYNNPAQLLLPDDAAQIADRYAELRNSVWQEDFLMGMLGDFENQIFNSGAYLRDVDRWPDSTQEDPELKLKLFSAYVKNRLACMDIYISQLN